MTIGRHLQEERQVYQVQANSIVFYATVGLPRSGFDMWDILPFSRGTVNTASIDRFMQSVINVNHLTFDMDVQIAIARLARKIRHLIGTAAMTRRSLGGIGDAKLEVYDTEHVRVVDGSVILLNNEPLWYGVAEKVADLILGRSGHFSTVDIDRAISRVHGRLAKAVCFFA
ncbi:hypothetical protein MPER_12345 [Moniliophthora perniciosa FA553]|nr:hypothetical protein MPER_12345 [Moniliophthora perniciosa FA553]